MRIVSLVPGITEFLFAVGLGDQVVGRSHGCDHPPAAQAVPAVTSGSGDPDPPLSARHLTGAPAYDVDLAALASLMPDIVVGFEGSVPEGTWQQLALPFPMHLEEVLSQLDQVGTAVGGATESEALLRRLRVKLARLGGLLAERPRPRVAVIEWTTPLITPGSWVPDLVESGGGRNVFGSPGQPAAVADFDDLTAAQPDVVLLAFAGLTLYETQARFRHVMKHPRWRPATRASRVLAIDASAYVARPGPRLVTGAELVAWALHRPHPVMQPPPGRLAELIEAGWVDLAAVRPHVEEPA